MLGVLIQSFCSLLIAVKSRMLPSLYWVPQHTRILFPLVVCSCVPIAMQSFHEVEALSFSEQLIVEHNRGSWFLHCGRYVTQQGGCIPCFLHKAGVFDFRPWRPEEDPDNCRADFKCCI